VKKVGIKCKQWSSLPGNFGWLIELEQGDHLECLQAASAQALPLTAPRQEEEDIIGA
jgi:hypothetical protein